MKAMKTLSNARIVGGIGSILLLSSLLSFTGLGPLAVIAGLVMILVAVYWISEAVNDMSIFRDVLIASVIYIVGVSVIRIFLEIGGIYSMFSLIPFGMLFDNFEDMGIVAGGTLAVFFILVLIAM